MSDANAAHIARSWAEAAWNQHDLDAAVRFLAPDWVGHYAGLCEATGPEGFKQVADAFISAFPDMHIVVEDALADGDKLVRRVSWTATHKGTFLGIQPTGRRVMVRETIILRIAEERIAEEWQVGDMLGLLRQLGAVPDFPQLF